MINEFRGEHRFLSNFWPVELVLPDRAVAPSVEHAYQAYKALRDADYAAILAAATPGEAKRLGRVVTTHAGWEVAKLDVMRRLLALKFPAGSALAGRLLATGDALLVEGNTWGDRFWGVCADVGANWLGHLLMARRAELRGEFRASARRSGAEW